MKKILVVLLAALFLFNLTAYAQLNPKYQAKSGDKKLDTTLTALDQKAKANPEKFLSDLSQSFNVARTKIDEMVNKVKMPLADVFIALKTADIAKKPVDTVVEEYQKNKGKGWGVIAKRMGIKPGSKEFHELKNAAAAALEKTKKDVEEKQKKEKEEKEKKLKQEKEKKEKEVKQDKGTGKAKVKLEE